MIKSLAKLLAIFYSRSREKTFEMLKDLKNLKQNLQIKK